MADTTISTENYEVAKVLATMVLVQQTDLKDPKRVADAFRSIYQAVQEATSGAGGTRYGT